MVKYTEFTMFITFKCTVHQLDFYLNAAIFLEHTDEKTISLAKFVWEGVLKKPLM